MQGLAACLGAAEADLVTCKSPRMHDTAAADEKAAPAEAADKKADEEEEDKKSDEYTKDMQAKMGTSLTYK